MSASNRNAPSPENTSCWHQASRSKENTAVDERTLSFVRAAKISECRWCGPSESLGPENSVHARDDEDESIHPDTLTHDDFF